MVINNKVNPELTNRRNSVAEYLRKLSISFQISRKSDIREQNETAEINLTSAYVFSILNTLAFCQRG
jgi:hypothetical protein